MRSFLFCTLVFLAGCQPKSSENALFTLHQPSTTGVLFSNDLHPDRDLNIITFEYFNNGAGVGIGDIDRDGLPDLFFTGNMTGSRLYKNNGDFRFSDITEQAGIDTQGRWATGVNMVDLNQDGWLDIYVSCAGPYEASRRSNLLFINQQNGTFREEAQIWGLADQGHTTQTAFFDYDRDGDLDAYLLTNIMEHVGPNVIRKKKTQGESPNTDRLYRNDNGRFVQVSHQAGITIEGYGLGLAVADLNLDGWLDIYVSNDYLSNDLLYINQGDGTFANIAPQAFRHTSYSSMGTDVADINNDGLPDILSVDMLPPDNKRRKLMMGSIRYDRFRSEILSGYFPQYMRNTLQAHRGVLGDTLPVFSEIGQFAGIHSTDWSWSPLLADIDNDGHKDLLVTNGYPKDVTNMDFASYKMATMMKGQWNNEMKDVLFNALKDLEGAYLPNQVFRNTGDFKFDDLSREWGFQQPSYSHGAALGDLDADGDLDYVVNNTDAPAFIYENRQTDGNYLQFQPAPDIPPALLHGATFNIYTAEGRQQQVFQPARGYQSSVEPLIHFGLGQLNGIDSLIVHWTNGQHLKLGAQSANQRLLITYAAMPMPTEQLPSPTWMRPLSEKYRPDYTHKESHYADFKVQPLLWQKYSQQGPPLAVADVNGDGLSDFFVGGAFRQAGTLFTQNPDGSFQSLPLPGENHYEEDVAATFLDVDQDGDQDLFVGSGGSEFPLESTYYQDRMYINDGQGHFTLASGILPAMPVSTGCVAAEDYDRDGDIDLFVGGRIHPQIYAEIPNSYLLRNDNGRFSMVPLPQNGKLGRISDAIWTDWNEDGRPDLILAGEWTPITIVYQTENGFSLTNIPHSTGLWNSLHQWDLDQDGDQDIIAGNIGLNHPFGESLSIHTNDFDQNGTPESLLTIQLQGKEVPYHYRDDLLQWLFPLKKVYKNYTAYAETDWASLFPEKIKDTQTQTIDQFASGWFEKRGGEYVFHPFPPEAQWSPVYDWLVKDLNHDQKPELIGLGNSFAPEPGSGRMDASYGLLLSQKDDLTFQSIPWTQSGYFCPGDGKHLAWIQQKATGNGLLLASMNNDRLQTFAIPLAPPKALQ